jgi:hypothetical protein
VGDAARRGLVRQREEEHKLLALQLNDFLRQLENEKKKVPQLRAYDAEIAQLDRQLARERADVDRITAKLEAPDLRERERAYCGRDFTLRELEDKASVCEQRINAKEQQLWEKQIVLREIEEKIAEKTRIGGTEDPDTVKAFERRGLLRAEAISLRRRTRAAIAESAVCQAQSVELEDEKRAVKDGLGKAAERVEMGQGFDEYAAKIVRMHERDALTPMSVGRDANSEEDEERRAGRKHFDAYPTADGLSRPYGAFPVFQPAPASGQLRHFRKEALRPIEL